MSRGALVELLRERLGLDPATLGERVIDDALAEACRELGVDDEAALLARALVDSKAYGAIVEQIVVPETWFFRAPEQFQDMVRFANGEGSTRRPLRVLCLPCATGEEVYSAAIALLEAGLTPEQFDILGIDVGPHLVARAQAGVYRRRAWRGREPDGWWATEQGTDIAMTASIRRCVRWRVGNALDPALFLPGERFDVVFCRNLLIYLHAEARKQLLLSLASVMEAPALILAGQAEALPAMDARFVPFGQMSPLSYRYEPGATPPRVVPLKLPSWVPNAGAAPARQVATSVAEVGAARSAARIDLPAQPVAADSADISIAQRLADAGDLVAARDACQKCLRLFPNDAAAHYLLGLIESARGDTQGADAAFARVVFLDRNHVEALDRRVTLTERMGHPVEAQRLRERVKRLRQRLDK